MQATGQFFNDYAVMIIFSGNLFTLLGYFWQTMIIKLDLKAVHYEIKQLIQYENQSKWLVRHKIMMTKLILELISW